MHGRLYRVRGAGFRRSVAAQNGEASDPSSDTICRCFDRFEKSTQIGIAAAHLDGGSGPHGAFESPLVWRRNDEWLRLERRRHSDRLQKVPVAGIVDAD